MQNEIITKEIVFNSFIIEFFFTKETANKVQSLQLWNFKGSVGRAIVKWVLSDLWLDLPGSAFSIHCSLMMICRHVPCDKPLGVMRFEHENPMRSNNSKPNRNFVEMVRGNYIDYILKVVKKIRKTQNEHQNIICQNLKQSVIVNVMQIFWLLEVV